MSNSSLLYKLILLVERIHLHAQLSLLHHGQTSQFYQKPCSGLAFLVIDYEQLNKTIRELNASEY
jgi:hypothetical protein